MELDGKSRNNPVSDEFAETLDRIYGKYCDRCSKRHKEDCPADDDVV